jgi:hypothetical protein
MAGLTSIGPDSCRAPAVPSAAGTATGPIEEPWNLIRSWRWQAQGALLLAHRTPPAAKAGRPAGHQSLITGYGS